MVRANMKRESKLDISEGKVHFFLYFICFIVTRQNESLVPSTLFHLGLQSMFELDVYYFAFHEMATTSDRLNTRDLNLEFTRCTSCNDGVMEVSDRANGRSPKKVINSLLHCLVWLGGF